MIRHAASGALDRGRLFYVRHASPFGDFVVVWCEGHKRAEIWRVFLPGMDLQAALKHRSPGVTRRTQPDVQALARDIEAFLTGRDVTFRLDDVALDRCGRFQRQVLRTEHAIPRGRVSTYGAIAAHLGRPRAARAVGRALATNPFPIIVPCHRAIRADLSLGGYQGGLAMKRALLEFEGLRVSPAGRVIGARVYYGRRTAQ